MIKKGIILAGGMGTRMSPLTKAVNKQLLPIYDKPLIFYPLSILMLAKIKNILIIVNKGQLNQYKKLIPNGNNLGIKITYKEQDKPRGLPDAFILGEKFIEKKSVAMILGDNFFYGHNLSSILLSSSKIKDGAGILLHKVQNPELFGVAKIDKNNQFVICLNNSIHETVSINNASFDEVLCIDNTDDIIIDSKIIYTDLRFVVFNDNCKKSKNNIDLIKFKEYQNKLFLNNKLFTPDL
jgi:glucose-1-phosphate thymidylyltransferase short form